MSSTSKPLNQKHVGYFVRGLMVDNANLTGQDPSTENYEFYINDTISLVISHLQGRRTLDGSCSDLQCHAALEAKKVFS